MHTYTVLPAFEYTNGQHTEWILIWLVLALTRWHRAFMCTSFSHTFLVHTLTLIHNVFPLLLPIILAPYRVVFINSHCFSLCIFPFVHSFKFFCLSQSNEISLLQTFAVDHTSNRTKWNSQFKILHTIRHSFHSEIGACAANIDVILFSPFFSSPTLSLEISFLLDLF